MPHIRITTAGQFIKKVGIEAETAIVGAVTEVSDEFVKRLDAEFPHVAYEKVEAPAEEKQPVEQAPAGGDNLKDGGGNDPKDKETKA